MPQPAEDHGVWKLLQQTAPAIWEEDVIVDADDAAGLPVLQLREGWHELSDLEGP
jgi:hypothetical protein